MDRANLTGKVATGIMELTWMINDMAKVRCIGLMVRCIMAFGNMEPSMALESFIYQMDRERREYSRIMFI
jgi:hypothetical protein